MKLFLRITFLYLPGSLLLAVLILATIIWQNDMVSRSELEDLRRMARNQGIGSVIEVIRIELTGSSAMATDPSYGRELVTGRGHAPWVLRGNLDGRPRVLSFALAPGLWVAYDTAQASLYQVWEGDLLLQGVSYDYRHGPQPQASGAWYFRASEPAQWFIRSEADGTLQAATVQYLGHEYGTDRKTAGYRFALTSPGIRLELTEFPELRDDSGRRTLLRQFQVTAGGAQYTALYQPHDGDLTDISQPVALPLAFSVDIVNADYRRVLASSDDVIENGRLVIENSDCLSCHSESHQVAGPAWSRIAGRFRGNLQEESRSGLADSIQQGSQGKWGPAAMPPHRDMPREHALAAATYILNRPESRDSDQILADANGLPYATSRDFDVNPRLDSVHPGFELDNLLPKNFQPKVSGMDFRADGKLLVSSWDADGSVFLVDPLAPPASRVQRIAEGLHEPLGLKVVGERLFVLQKQELTELIDSDGDELIDQYRAVSYDWPATSNFHSFAFGLEERDGYLYALLSVCVLPGGASCPEQLPTQGKLLRINPDNGQAEIFASGFRTPNGIGHGPGGELFVTDNQGDWLPANKLIHVQQGKFYGSRAVPDEGVMDAVETAPVVWLPQDEIGNSPSQPLLLVEAPYAGQMIHGDVTHGGIKRVYMESVDGALQGAVMRFSGGIQGGVNRLVRGPDGHIYIGEIGNPPNWSAYGNTWYGLSRLRYGGKPAFEILRVNATADGFRITLTEPVADTQKLTPADLTARHWFYHPTEQYGGPKYDPTELVASDLQLSEDRRQITARIEGLKAGYVVYLRLDPRLKSATAQSLWTDEAWYTLNAIPDQPGTVAAPTASRADQEENWIQLFNGTDFGGWRNYRGQEGEVEKWVVEDGALHLQPGRFGFLSMVASYLFGGTSGDLVYGREKFGNFELSLEWKIADSGNSGIFYFITDETHSAPWQTGLEMQVLDNDGHPDGQIKTHRAGDLYDMVAADPETVKPPGQWNQARIRVQNNRIEHWLNGTRVVSVQRGSAQWQQLLAASKFADMPGFAAAEQGYIGLQDHGDPVWYRNIRIRRLND